MAAITEITHFECKSVQSSGRFTEVSLCVNALFTNMGELIDIDLESLRKHLLTGYQQYCKFKPREAKPPCGNLGVPMRHG